MKREKLEAVFREQYFGFGIALAACLVVAAIGAITMATVTDTETATITATTTQDEMVTAEQTTVTAVQDEAVQQVSMKVGTACEAEPAIEMATDTATTMAAVLHPQIRTGLVQDTEKMATGSVAIGQADVGSLTTKRTGTIGSPPTVLTGTFDAALTQPIVSSAGGLAYIDVATAGTVELAKKIATAKKTGAAVEFQDVVSIAC